MTAEEYFRRFIAIMKKEACGPKPDMNEGFKGFIPVLDTLNRDGKQKSGDIASKLDISTARVASILNNMEAKGFARRENSEKDKRVTFVEITEEGKKFLNDFKKIQKEKMNKILEDISDEDMEVFFVILEKILHGMNDKKEEKENV